MLLSYRVSLLSVWCLLPRSADAVAVILSALVVQCWELSATTAVPCGIKCRQPQDLVLCVPGKQLRLFI